MHGPSAGLVDISCPRCLGVFDVEYGCLECGEEAVAKPIAVTCPHCSGCGRVELNGVYADTLELLKKQRGESTAADLAKIDGCAATAMSNRLAALERYGLAVSRRYGRKRLFRAVGT